MSSNAQGAIVGPNDVLCGRQKDAFNNLGNRKFRVIVDNHLSQYVNAPTRKGKSAIIQAIADLMKQIGGRFLKKQSSKTGGVVFAELNKKQACEKIGHALRDMSHANKKIKKNGDKTTQSSLNRRKRALQVPNNEAVPTFISCETTPQPSQPPANPDAAYSQQQQQQKAPSELSRSTAPVVHQKPFCQTENHFASASRMPFSPYPSGTSAGTSNLLATAPPPIARWTSSHSSISMSPEDIGFLISCLNSNQSTTSVSSVASTSICPSKEDFDALMKRLTSSTASMSSSCSLLQDTDPLEAAVGGAAVHSLPPKLRSWESVTRGDMTAFLDCLTGTSSSTFSAVTFSDKA